MDFGFGIGMRNNNRRRWDFGQIWSGGFSPGMLKKFD